MTSKRKEEENEPFLEYTDDPAQAETGVNRIFDLAQKRRKKVLSHGIVFAITSLLWMLIFWAGSAPSPHHTLNDYNSTMRHNITSDARLVSCGTTLEEAKANGCKYDILLNHWVPEQCVDDEFLKEYQDDASWGAYKDEALTERMTVEEMAESDSYWTSIRDHVNHCAVIWKKQFWYLFEERPTFDSIIASGGHTDHCAQYLMDAPTSNWTKPTRVERGFAGCWIRE